MMNRTVLGIGLLCLAAGQVHAGDDFSYVSAAQLKSLDIPAPATVAAAPLAPTDPGYIAEPLPCGLYDEATAPLDQKDLDTQNPDPAQYTLSAVIPSGRKLSATVKYIRNGMVPGERYYVAVSVDGQLLARINHIDVPFAMDVFVDGAKYRLICVTR
jgi:hypothetical protein